MKESLLFYFKQNKWQSGNEKQGKGKEERWKLEMEESLPFYLKQKNWDEKWKKGKERK